MAALKLTFFTIGTIAFFVAVYLSVKHPELADSSGESSEIPETVALKKWDKASTWIMWSGWGIAGLLTFLGRAGFLEAFK